jgi:hypothetical protein
MSGRECFHCRQWIEQGEKHDCWTTTEAALTRDLSEDLRDAWERLRETAVEFGEQRIYASHNSIMFARKACYFFVRPKRSYLEVVFFLGRTLRSSRIRQAVQSSRVKVAHVARVVHRDEVEAPLTDWLREAYQLSDTLRTRSSNAPKKQPLMRKRSSAAREKRSGASVKRRSH